MTYGEQHLDIDLSRYVSPCRVTVGINSYMEWDEVLCKVDTLERHFAPDCRVGLARTRVKDAKRDYEVNRPVTYRIDINLCVPGPLWVTEGARDLLGRIFA